MSDCLAGTDPEYCPTLEDCHAELRALLPSGLAWEAAHRPDTGMWGFWRAVAHLTYYAHTLICALREQFWCASTDVLRDQWLVEYGLPDACDPFPDLCAKVAALGGTQCAYYEEMARRAGWSLVCLSENADCGAYADNLILDCDVVGGDFDRSRLVFEVHVDDSPAYVAPEAGPISLDCTILDAAFGCDPDIGPLACILERVVPAHVEVVYRIVYRPMVLSTERLEPVSTEDGAFILTA